MRVSLSHVVLGFPLGPGHKTLKLLSLPKHSDQREILVSFFDVLMCDARVYTS